MATLKVQKRSEIGTRAARRLRDKGLIPAVIYGHGEGTLSVALSEHDIAVHLQHGEKVMDLDIEGDSESVLVNDVQWDHFGQHILHVDLTRVNLDEKVTYSVAVILRGTPKEEGILAQPTAEIEVECRVRDIPDEIRIPVTWMTVGDTITAGELKMPKGSTLVTDPEEVVATLQPMLAEEEVEEEGAEDLLAEPEVIGEKPEEEEAEGAEASEE